MQRLRVMTYNICLGGRARRALRDVVRLVDPDVLLVNEAPKEPWIATARCRRLARKWGMTYVAGGRDAGSNIIAVDASVSALSSTVQLLPQAAWSPRRGIASAQLWSGGASFGVVSCHLSLDRPGRGAEVQEVIAAADRLDGPVIVAGDLNERPDGPSWAALREAGFEDHGSRNWLTFPAAWPERRIDALLVRGAVTVLHHGDPGLPVPLVAAASDHLPVLAVVEL